MYILLMILRSYSDQVEYMLEKCDHKWKKIQMRINSLDYCRQNIGWIHSKYDENIVENDLDDYAGFNYVLNDNGSTKELQN